MLQAFGDPSVFSCAQYAVMVRRHKEWSSGRFATHVPETGVSRCVYLSSQVSTNKEYDEWSLLCSSNAHFSNVLLRKRKRTVDSGQRPTLNLPTK
jgi:hypothetical protein